MPRAAGGPRQHDGPAGRGAGTDRLAGATDYDTYGFYAGDGTDTILDEDGSGEIQVAGVRVSGADASQYRRVDGVATWTDAAGRTYAFHDSGNHTGDLTISYGNLGSDTITVKDFDLSRATGSGCLGLVFERGVRAAWVGAGEAHPLAGRQGADPASFAAGQAGQGWRHGHGRCRRRVRAAAARTASSTWMTCEMAT